MSSLNTPKGLFDQSAGFCTTNLLSTLNDDPNPLYPSFGLVDFSEARSFDAEEMQVLYHPDTLISGLESRYRLPPLLIELVFKMNVSVMMNQLRNSSYLRFASVADKVEISGQAKSGIVVQMKSPT